MCIDYFHEYFLMRKLKRAIIIEKSKRDYLIDVRKFFVDSSSVYLQDIIQSWKSLAEDQKTQKCLEWVKTNITYKTEEKDFWNFPNETLASKVGDCEDGAILLANLMLACGLKYYDIMLNVVNTPLGFHVYVTYKNQIYDWTSLIHSDWKFWYCWNARNAYTTPENVELWKK